MDARRSWLRSTVTVLLVMALACGLVGPAFTSGLFGQEWAARYNGPGDWSDYGEAIAVDAAGAVYVTGASYSQATNLDYATVKYDASGTPLWTQRYDGPASLYDFATAIAVDAGGNVYVTGYSPSGTGYDFATIKYDPDGNQLWVRRYDGPGHADDQAFALALDAGGNVYVTGRSVGAGFDYATIKYDTSGNELWVRRYNAAAGADAAYAVAVDGSGNVYITGESSNGANSDYATLKYDANGALLWVQRYAGAANGDDVAQDLAVDAAGNVYATGYSYGGTPTNHDYATVKYDPDGNLLWSRRYNGPGFSDDKATALGLDGNGSPYVTGSSFGGVGTGDDFATIRYDTDGNQLWVHRYDGPASGHDQAAALAVDGSGNVYITGYSRGIRSSQDYATVACDANGTQLWVQRYNGPASLADYPRALAVDGSGNVYVTGQSLRTARDSDFDYATVKYSDHPTNNAPEVDPDRTVTVNEDSSPTELRINAPTDPDDDPLTITVTSVPDSARGFVRRGGGTAVAVSDTLTSAELTALEFVVVPDANGSAGVFRYSVSDGRGGIATQTITLQITAVNEPPIARDDSYSGWLGCPLRVAAPGVLGNDTDGEGDPLTAALVQQPASGTVTLNPNGSFVYTPGTSGGGIGGIGGGGPGPGLGGIGPVPTGPTTVRFTYRAYDGTDYSPPATVTLTLQADTVPPTCTFGSAVRLSGPTVVYVPATVGDSGSGVASVQITTASRNCKLVDPVTSQEVAIGGTLTYDPTLSTRTLWVVKLDINQSASVTLRVTDCAGNSFVADPVQDDVEVPQRRLTRVYRNLPAAEHFLKLDNGTPGLLQVKLWVNGHSAHSGDLGDGQVLRVDLGPWMKAGRRNTVRLTASGPSGSTASLLIGDAAFAGGVPGAPNSGGGHGSRAWLELPR